MIKNGELDIIVGTHSLLGDRVVYNNLGLLVVDEEQVCPLSSPPHIANILFFELQHKYTYSLLSFW